MKELINIISQIVSLLNECGWDEKAAWYSDVKEKLRRRDVCSEESRNCLIELENSIAGMGSFSDLPMKSKTGNRTQQELRDQQWDLAEKLGDAIEKLKN